MNKTISFIALGIFAFSVLVQETQAQILKINSYGQSSLDQGDFSNTGLTEPEAGYISSAFTGGLEFIFYPTNKLGIGTRWSATRFYRDTEAFSSDFKDANGLNGGTYHINQPYMYASFGFELGLTYLIAINESWDIEPYFYLGRQTLLAQGANAIYTSGGTTVQYQQEIPFFYGFSYAPGVRFNWNINNHWGLSLNAEYRGVQYVEAEEVQITFTADDLFIEEINRDYSISSINFGLGFSYRFGKGLTE